MNKTREAIIFLLQTIISHNPSAAAAQQAQSHIESIVLEDADEQAGRYDADQPTAHDQSFGGQDAGLAGVGKATSLEDTQEL